MLLDDGLRLFSPPHSPEALGFDNPKSGMHPLKGVHPKMGVSFWLPLESYTGMLSPLLWTTPNLGCTLSKSVSLIFWETSLTIGAFGKDDRFGLT